MTPDRIDELIALAALGELSPADESELQRAVRDDAALAKELDEVLSTAAMIQRTHASDPPPSLRANVLAAVARTPQDGVDDPAAMTAPTAGDSPAPISLDAERRRRRWGPMLTAAAAVVVFVVAAAVLVTNDDARAPDQYSAILDAADAERHTLAGDMPGTLTVTFSDSFGAVVVAGDGLPVLDDDETYQLWVDIDGHMTPAGLFRPDDDGHVEARIDGIETTGTSINVTTEPAGGSDEPTLPVLASSA